MAINVGQVIQIINNIGDVMEKNIEYLTELDSAIGDADHGINMAKGFKAVKEKLSKIEANNVGDVLKVVGLTLVSNVGGAAGPLYGTAFMKGAAAANKEEIDIEDFINILRNAAEGIKMRGKSKRGEKTILDSLEPALEALIYGREKKLDNMVIIENMRDEALKGVEYTKGIVATKGRASYLGERSLGHQDPGATSCYLMLNEIYSFLAKEN
ncbi:dihydroxyacetone kinase subunit DhaL [uncultured Clostridium sp.]|uniref:dihydroxyacetone kinase subunit DhaL n=1 Tax=uncultured Clostridium sp. TaxID=59620 RepID=UPI0028F035C4|nr:dihydroxyacetone kinase subunit DhaL [uncultured Clostridium sp.]